MNMKRSLLVGAAVAAVTVGGLGSVGLVSAAASDTDSADSSTTSLVQKIANKFNVSTSDVQAIFDADRTEKQAEMKADQKERLAAAVTAGELTQAQADHITQALDEIDTLRGTTKPEDEDSTTHDQIKAKMDALRTWADDNSVDMKYVGPGGGHGPGGPDGIGGPKDSSDSDSSSN